jgi:hypothetical protein
MARSVGITISAVVVFIGSALTLLFGGFAALGSAIMSLHPAANMPPFVGYLAIVEAVFALGLSGWGIATGVGLLNAKEWARISMIVFAAILALFTVPTAFFMAFVPLPFPKDANLPANFALIMRIGISVFYGLLGALAIFWLYFFNRRSVKAQFQGKQPEASVLPLVPLAAEIASAVPQPSTRTRPLSITIIAWFLLVSAALTPLSLLYSRVVFRNVPMPFCFLGFFLFGRTATVVLLIWMAVQIAAAVGLLKLRNWALLTTIGLQLLGMVNVLLLVLVPANRARFQHTMDAAMGSMMPQMPQPISFAFPVWIGMIASLPIFLVILWFLITRRQAFASPS